MEYQGPEPADLANVEALNEAFLQWLRTRKAGVVIADDAVAALADSLAGMKDCEIGRLSRTPFLLMSANDEDERYWRQVFASNPHTDLLDAEYRPDGVESSLLMATLGFLWHVAKRNPYAARLVSGTSVEWCDQLAALPLVALYEQIGRCSPLRPRLAHDGDFWRKLLGPGISSRKDVRLAARISAMQMVLTGSAMKTRRPLAAAACSLPTVSMRVADRRRD